MSKNYVSEEYLYLTRDLDEVVNEKDQRQAYVFANPGTVIPEKFEELYEKYLASKQPQETAQEQEQAPQVEEAAEEAKASKKRAK